MTKGREGEVSNPTSRTEKSIALSRKKLDKLYDVEAKENVIYLMFTIVSRYLKLTWQPMPLSNLDSEVNIIMTKK